MQMLGRVKLVLYMSYQLLCCITLLSVNNSRMLCLQLDKSSIIRDKLYWNSQIFRELFRYATKQLSTVPKDSQSNELDLIIWIEWDHSKSRVPLTEGVDQYEIIGKVREYFNQDEDARITFFSKCIPVLDSLTLCLMLRKYNLQDDFWWNDMHMSSFAPLHQRYVNVSL